MTSRIPIKKLIDPPINLLGFGLGSGLAPFAPGTWGTLVAIPIILGLANFSDYFYLLITTVCLISGIWICQIASDSLNSAKGGEGDHPAIVWDEIVGMLITMMFIPISAANLLLGFVLFRAFDIIKPWPISVLDKRIKGGLGIMLDDVVAGIFANICLFTLLAFI